MIKRSDPFEMSVEYDLFNSSFGSEVLELFDIEALIYECEKNIIYKVYRKSDFNLFMLMAFRKLSDPELNNENLTDLYHERNSETLFIGETETFQYVIKPFVEVMGKVQ